LADARADLVHEGVDVDTGRGRRGRHLPKYRA
jgi:hypothetical protein